MRTKNGLFAATPISKLPQLWRTAMKKWIALAAMTMAVTVSGNVLAHGEQAKHGGIIQNASDLHFELVNNNGAAKIYVDDHGKAFSTAGASGKLTVLNGSEKTEVLLQPAGDNALETKGDAKLMKGAKVVASITFANKKTVSVRFSVK